MSFLQQFKNKMKNLSKRQFWLVAYLPIHLTWYMILEEVHVDEYYIVPETIDHLIPFFEWFIIPYMLWFVYMVSVGMYYLVKEEKAFEKYMLTMWIGFFLALLFISFVPTGQELRPDVFPRENIATFIVAFIYDFDTNTNVFPSMHVIGSITVGVSILQSESLKNNLPIKIASTIMCILIVAATVFLKQHAFVDILGGIVFYIVAYILASFITKKWHS